MRKYIKIFIGLGIIIIVGLMCYMVSRISELEYAQKIILFHKSLRIKVLL